MPLPETLARAGAALGALGGLYYLADTLAGRARPNRVTWLLWGVFPMVVFAAQRAQGVQGLSWVSFAAGLTPLLVFAASFFNRGAYWRTEPRDVALMAAGILGMAQGALTDRPNLALAFALAADVLASLPTLLKAWRHPHTESWAGYAISAAGFGLSLLAVRSLAFAESAFAAYVFLLNAALAALAARRPGAARAG